MSDKITASLSRADWDDLLVLLAHNRREAWMYADRSKRLEPQIRTQVEVEVRKRENDKAVMKEERKQDGK